MRLVTYSDGAEARPGVLDGDEVLGLEGLGLPGTMQELISAGEPALARLRRDIADGRARRRPLGSVQLLAPLPWPRKGVFCAGKNYADHAREYGMSGYDKTLSDALPKHPVLFVKLPSCVVGTGAEILSHSEATRELDYEAELAFIIGKPGRRISRERAMEHVFGYTLVNDVTARDWQKGHDQWAIGKSFDTFCPMGPAIVTADAVASMEHLAFRCFVNGELRQEGRPWNLLFDIPALISLLSQGVTLEPGDVIATGSPLGPGIGFKPPRFLRPGDEVRIENALIGTLVNRVV
jgi:2-keto-4-pentenoate hydratase/2-oxohepta-3-ene-1,7-dioic acid hydratase in catechol pathway